MYLIFHICWCMVCTSQLSKTFMTIMTICISCNWDSVHQKKLSLEIDMLRQAVIWNQKALTKAQGWVIFLCHESLEIQICKVFPTHYINSQAFIKLLLSASTKESCYSLIILKFAAEALWKWKGPWCLLLELIQHLFIKFTHS